MASAATVPDTLYAGDVTPVESWSALTSNEHAQLIDVRTQAEWSFSGVPSLSSLNKTLKTISWKHYPTFALNERFLEQLQAAIPDKSAPLYFLCKTGGRSTDAAIAATQPQAITIVSISKEGLKATLTATTNAAK